MAEWYARLNDLGANAGTEADPFTTLGAALAVAANGDRIRMAGDGTDDPFLDQLDLDPFHTLAVVQWAGQPQAHIDFQGGVGIGFDQATVKKDGGWAQGGFIELEGFHVWNTRFDQDNAFCVVLQNCDQATQKVTYDCIIRQNTAARGLMIIQPSAGTFEITGEVWDAVGSPGGHGRCLYITGQDGGFITVNPFKILRCATDDHAAYCSVQLSGKTVLDHLFVEQFGTGTAFTQWLKESGTLHVLRSHFSYPSSGGLFPGVLVADSTVGTGETIFERVEVDALRDCDPLPRRIAFALADAPDVKIRNCTLIGDLLALYIGDSVLHPPHMTGSPRSEIINTILVARSEDPGSYLVRAEANSTAGASFDGNCYHMLDSDEFRISWGGTVYWDMRTWQLRARQDSWSLQGHPGLQGITRGRFHLTRTSICRDACIICPLLTDTDANGTRATHINPQTTSGVGGSALDIGAFEYDAFSRSATNTLGDFGRPIYGLRPDSRPVLRGWYLE